MDKNKGYGLVIPENYNPGMWDKLATPEIIKQLKVLTREAFYRMAEDVKIDILLLKKSGYEYDGVSEIALMESQAYLSEEVFDKVKQLLRADEFNLNGDFQYVFHLFNDCHSVVNDLYTDEQIADIMQFRTAALRNKPELMLMELFIEEFEDDKTSARKSVLQKYGGHFIHMQELESFLSCRSSVEWYRGDTFDAYYDGAIQKMKSMKDLIALLNLLSGEGEFQVKSTKFKHQKITINKHTAKMLAKAIAMVLKVYHDTDPDLSLAKIEEKTFVSWELLLAEHDIEEIEKYVNSLLEDYEAESDLSLFYYLADNAICWPKEITITKRCLFLYRLAKYFKYIPESEFDYNISTSSAKEIVDGIKYILKLMYNRDKDGNILNNYIKN